MAGGRRKASTTGFLFPKSLILTYQQSNHVIWHKSTKQKNRCSVVHPHLQCRVATRGDRQYVGDRVLGDRDLGDRGAVEWRKPWVKPTESYRPTRKAPRTGCNNYLYGNATDGADVMYSVLTPPDSNNRNVSSIPRQCDV